MILDNYDNDILKDKTIVLGVTGGIAVYKALDLISILKKLGGDVKVIMTKSAAEFVAPLTFQSISQNPVALDMFVEPKSWEIRHISLAKQADVFAVAPCTANVIGKIANGIADDMLTTTVMATKAPVLIAPAMNTNMFENRIVQDNINKLEEYGYNFVMPTVGRLACGDTGKGKLAPVEIIAEEIIRLARIKDWDLTGKKVLITAGATREAIDPVRYITNHSTGKMGFSLARAAAIRGAEVTLVAGHNTQDKASWVKTVNVDSAEDMYNAVMEYAEDADIIIKSAAVADFTPKSAADNKLKKEDVSDMRIELKRTKDILQELGIRYGDKKIIVGFCMETENLIENAIKKCRGKNIGLIAANSLRQEGAGFGSDTNIITIVGKDGVVRELPLASKFKIANQILDEALKLQRLPVRSE